MEKYIAEVEKGKTFLIMKKSKPAFKMVPVDEWGDEGIWKTVADFAHLPGGGLPGDEFLRMIREAKKKHNGSAK